MKWLKLMIASIFEVFWAVCMNYSEGFTKVIPSILTGIGYILSAVFLAMALKELPLSTSYAVWTGIGIVGTTIFGAILFKEQISFPQVICILLIAIGIIGLKVLSE